MTKKLGSFIAILTASLELLCNYYSKEFLGLCSASWEGNSKPLLFPE